MPSPPPLTVTSSNLHALEQLQEGVQALQELLPELVTPLCGPTDEDIPARTHKQHCLQHTLALYNTYLTNLHTQPSVSTVILLEVSDEALDAAELESLLGGVALKLEAALQVTVAQMVHKGPDYGGHQVLLGDQHPRLGQGGEDEG